MTWIDVAALVTSTESAYVASTAIVFVGLIVGPTGLLKNWIAEHDKHLTAPGLGEPLEANGHGTAHPPHPVRCAGAGVPRRTPRAQRRYVDRLRAADWVLTTYETLRDYQHSFGRVRWAAVVFDEAQKVKNPTTLMTAAAKAMNADVCLGLTGTPVENRLADLWCVVDCVRPGVLSSLKEFCQRYEPASGYVSERLAELRAILQERNAPVMLRRMKADHLRGLPEIHVHVQRRDMPAVQADAYDQAVADARSATAGTGMLQALQRLRAVSLHPGGALGAIVSGEDFIAASARWTLAFETLDAIAAAKQKALVFLDFLVLQGVLAEIVQRRYGLDDPPMIINGQVPGRHRRRRVDRFQERRGFDVMVLSPRAGGVGLTLTAANHVVHLSRWWNPAVEDQCTDRVYRIGQERDVHVYLPLAIHPRYPEHSFDVRLDHLLAERRHLSRTVLAPVAARDEDFARLFRETVSG